MNINRRFYTCFTLIELLVAISIIAVLLAILLPVFAVVRNASKRSVCISNLRQIGHAFAMYNQDYEVAVPPTFDSVVLAGYLTDRRIMRCPLDENGNWGSAVTCSSFLRQNKPLFERSYLFVGEYFGSEYLDELIAKQSVNFLVCQMHGHARFSEISIGPCAADYDGAMLRLNADGSVNIKKIYIPPSGALDYCYFFTDSDHCVF